MKYSWKGHKDRNRYKNRIKRCGQSRLVYVTDINRNIPTTWRWARGDGLQDLVDKTVHDFVHHTDLFFYGTSLNELVTGSDYGRQKVARVYKNCVICTVAFTCGLAVRRYRLVSRRTSVRSASALLSLLFKKLWFMDTVLWLCPHN